MSQSIHFDPFKGEEFDPRKRESSFFVIPEKTENIILRLKLLLATPTFIDGVDMSHWNNERDFQKIRNSGIDFVILKATEGTGFKDATFDPSWRNALDNDLAVMPYHFFRSNYGGSVQVKWCLDNIQDFLSTVNGKTIIWNDVETSDGASISQRQNRLLASHQTFSANGFKSGNYSSPYLWNLLVGNVPWANDYLQWVAHWTSAGEPILPLGWSREKTKFWQYGIYPTYSWAKKVEGAGTVDVNRFYGTVKELYELLGVVAPPMDCCEEIRAEINRLDDTIRFIKGELGSLNQRVDLTEHDVVMINQDMAEIDRIILEVKKIFC